MFNEWRRLGDSASGRVSFIQLSPSPILNRIIIERHPSYDYNYFHLVPSPARTKEFNDIFLRFFSEMDNSQLSRDELISYRITLNKISLRKLKKLFAYLNDKNCKENNSNKAEFPPEITQEFENRLTTKIGLPIKHVIKEPDTQSYSNPANDLTDELIELLLEVKRNKFSIQQKKRLRMLLNSGANPNSYNSHGASALFYAIGFNLDKDVMILLLNYANPFLPIGNPFDEANCNYLCNSLELAGTHKHFEIFNLIILNFSSKPKKSISIEKMVMLEEKDQVTTQFYFSNKTTLSTVLKEGNTLTQAERNTTLQLYDRFFESGKPDDPECTLKKLLKKDISGDDKFVEHIFDDKKNIVGFLIFQTMQIKSHRYLLSKLSELLHFQLIFIYKTKMKLDARPNLIPLLTLLAMLEVFTQLFKLYSKVRKACHTQLVFHCVCSAIDPKYSSNGLMTLLSYRIPFSMQELTDKEIATYFSAIHFFSYRTVEKFLVYPKFRSKITDDLVDGILEKIFQKPITIYRDAMTCHYPEPLKVKALYYSEKPGITQVFFNSEILGICSNELTTPPRAAPTLFFVGDESFDHLKSFLQDALNVDFEKHVKEFSKKIKFLSSKFLTETEPKPARLSYYKSNHIFFLGQKVLANTIEPRKCSQQRCQIRSKL